MLKKCLNCGKELNKTQTKYCSISCQKQHQFSIKIQDWKSGKFNGMSGKYGLSKVIRKYMLEKAGYQCEICGWNKINPYTNKFPLEVHHIDGDYTNNREENLQVLCPNCHSLTSTYKALNKNGREGREDYSGRKQLNHCIDCGKIISLQSKRCPQCASLQRKALPPISRDELKNLIRTTPFITIGRQFKVSDNTIRKWCDKYELPRKVKDIKNMSDEDWINV